MAAAPIRPLAWEPPYATGAAQEMPKKTKKKKKKRKKKKEKRSDESPSPESYVLDQSEEIIVREKK